MFELWTSYFGSKTSTKKMLSLDKIRWRKQSPTFKANSMIIHNNYLSGKMSKSSFRIRTK